ncbi:PepSY-associated TM helix domain-containing protein [Sphingomonas quercus]|uniref:PepSY domain-containing protein n=1 Tax=Sphingomonas quercus TaxID=2842451 RepID=A0ABS6BKW7_9SPHN|nr:PepSY-associated TM helix domain-containing protein [Sphingomonas quercus]MBU3078814.1 PepSY domain-containing protein [Sphingomonas quercus]
MTKVGMRNAWFQVHKWIGLILAIAIIPICVTGAALVWDEPLGEMLNPQRVAHGAATLAPEAYVAAATAALRPGERLIDLRFPDPKKGGAVVASAAQPSKGQGGRPSRTTLWLDPTTGVILDRAGSNEGAIRVMHMIHGSLMIPGMGRPIVGWIGVAMTVSCISGLWLWWPTVGRWARGLRWRRHRNFDTNLHHLFGFWIVLPLAVLSITGVWISFPQVFGGGPGGAPQAQQRGGAGAAARPQRAQPDRAAMMRAQPLPDPATDLATAITLAEARPDQLAAISWPTDVQPVWTISVRGKGERPTQIKVDDATRQVDRPRREARAGPERETTSRLMRRIHDGTNTGVIWKVIITLGGILPAILAVTGIIMWWRARGWRGDVARRKKAKLVAAE